MNFPSPFAHQTLILRVRYIHVYRPALARSFTTPRIYYAIMCSTFSAAIIKGVGMRANECSASEGIKSGSRHVIDILHTYYANLLGLKIASIIYVIPLDNPTTTL